MKKGDNVYVLTGEHKGKEGIVLKIINKTSRVLVEGIEIIKRNEKNPENKHYFPIHRSNLKVLVDSVKKEIDKNIDKSSVKEDKQKVQKMEENK